MVISGKQKRPQKIALYGVEGIGKTTLGASFPVAVVIDTEDRTAHLDINRIVVRSWNELNQALDHILGADHFYQTLVLDTIDWAEKLATTDVLSGSNKESIEDFGYGKGYTFVFERMEQLLRRLEEIQRKHGMHIVVTSHAQIQRMDDPTVGLAYDRYTMKCRDRGKTNVAQMFKEWADAVFFCHYETLIVEQDGAQRAQGGMQRVIGTCHTAGYDAKNSYNMPSTIPMAWSEIAPYIDQPTSSPGVPPQATPPVQTPTSAPGDVSQYSDETQEKLRLQGIAIGLCIDVGGKTYVSAALKERNTSFKKMTLSECQDFVEAMREEATQRANERK